MMYKNINIKIFLICIFCLLFELNNTKAKQINYLNEIIKNDSSIYLYFYPKDALLTCIKGKLGFYNILTPNYDKSIKSIGIIQGLSEIESQILRDVEEYYPNDILISDFDNTISNFFNVKFVPTIIEIDSNMNIMRVDVGSEFNLIKKSIKNYKIDYLNEIYPLTSINTISKLQNDIFLNDKNLGLLLIINNYSKSILKYNNERYKKYFDINEILTSIKDSSSKIAFQAYVNSKNHINLDIMSPISINNNIYILGTNINGIEKYTQNNKTKYKLSNEILLFNDENYLKDIKLKTKCKIEINNISKNNIVTCKLYNMSNELDSILIFNLNSFEIENEKYYKCDSNITIKQDGNFEVILNSIYYISLTERVVFLLDTNLKVVDKKNNYLEKFINQIEKNDIKVYLNNYILKNNLFFINITLKNTSTLEHSYKLIKYDIITNDIEIIDIEIPNFNNTIEEIKLVDKLDDGRFEFIIKLEKSRWAMLYL